MTLVGKVLEKYQILDKVGQGGMAVVYRGMDTTLGREVAVKVLHPHLAELEESRLRLQREAQAVAKLHHENILEIFAYSGLDSPDSYIVTEFIHGKTLKEFLKDNPIPHPELAAMMVHEVCLALKHAHSFGVIHRDIKPENVMIRDDGLLKLTDFGIAQVVDKERMTVTGQLLGSPAYMAPEQVEGKPADFRSDVFSVGILLYQLATGDLPFRGKNPHEVLKKIAECKYLDPEIARPEVGARLSRIIGRALCREPEARHADISAMLAELDGYLEEAGVKEPRAELRKFFTDPKGYSSDFRPRLVAALTKAGERALHAKKTPQALELFNRVLTVDPTNTRVAKNIARLSRQRLWTRAGIYGVAVVAVVAAGAAAATLRPWRSAGAGPGPAVGAAPKRADAAALAAVPAADAAPASAPLLAPSGPAPAPDASTVSVAVAPTGRRPLPPPTKKAPAAATSGRPVVLEVKPAGVAVTVALNGKLLGSYTPGQRILVGPGPSTVTVRAPACYDTTIPILANDARTRIAVSLKWKPGRIVVQSNVPSALVTVKYPGTTRIGAPGAVIDVPTPLEAPNGEFTVQVSASAPGYRDSVTTVGLKAGQMKTRKLPLERSN